METGSVTVPTCLYCAKSAVHTHIHISCDYPIDGCCRFQGNVAHCVS